MLASLACGPAVTRPAWKLHMQGVVRAVRSVGTLSVSCRASSDMAAAGSPDEEPDRNEPQSSPLMRTIQQIWAKLSGFRFVVLLVIAFLASQLYAVCHQPVRSMHTPYSSGATVARQAAKPRQVIMYRAQKVFAANAFSKLCAVLTLCVPLVVATAYLYKYVNKCKLSDAMFKTYTILNDTPGADATSEETVESALVVNLTHVIGIFTYAIVLGVVVDDVSSTIGHIKRGNNAVFEAGHTVVLNNNRHTSALLKQWSIAQQEAGLGRSPVVLLADTPKEDLDVLVDETRAATGLEVIGREGKPYDIDDLNLVSAATARTIILLDPLQGAEWDEKMVPPHAATLVSLASIGAGPAYGQTLVMQMPDSLAGADTLRSAARLHRGSAPGGGVVTVQGLQALSELQAQCAIQPGLAAFHNAVFMQSKETPEFYVRGFPALEGQTFQAARRSFRDAVVVGYSNPATGLVLNPADDYVLAKGDEIVGLTHDASKFVPDLKLAERPPGTLEAAAAEMAAAGPVDAYCNKNVIVLCFDKPAPQVTQGLQDFLPARSKVTYVSLDPVELPQGRFAARQVTGSPASTETLLSAGLETADSVILTGVDEWSATNADIQILSSIAQLSDICQDLNRAKPLHVVAQARGGEVQNFTDALTSMTQPVGGAARVVTTDVLFTEDIVAGILTQSAMEPRIAPVITDIMDSRGNRVTMRSPLHYTRGHEVLTMAELEDRVRLQGDTVVGFYRQDGSLSIGSSKSQRVSIADVSHLAVISDGLKL